VQQDSQQDLGKAVKTTTTTTTTAEALLIGATAATVASADASSADSGADGDAEKTGITTPAEFTTQLVTTSPLAPGDEFDTAQLEASARAHLQAAKDIKIAVAALGNSAVAINRVNEKMQTDPNLVRSRQHVAEMRAALDAWSRQRWDNLGKLKAGDASAFES
jgi:hypothetical protein